MNLLQIAVFTAPIYTLLIIGMVVSVIQGEWDEEIERWCNKRNGKTY